MSRNFNKLDRAISYWRLRRIINYIKEGSNVCDLGCGDGDLLIKINKKLKLGKSLGIDLDVKEKQIDNISLMKKDIYSLPVDDETFDTVLMMAIIEHIEPGKVNEVLKEAIRILKKNGRLLLTTPTPLAKPLLEFMAFKLQVISREEIEDHKQYFSKIKTENILASRGLKKIKAKHFQCFMNSFFVYEKI